MKWYNASMYEVGTKVDLTFLNSKKVVASSPKKSAFQENLESTQTLYQAGTQLIFDRKTGRMGRRIRVDFA